LRSVVEKVMSPLMFDIASLKSPCTVDVDMVRKFVKSEAAA